MAAQVLRMRDAGRSLGEVAILFRINAQSGGVRGGAGRQGLPYVVRGAAGSSSVPRSARPSRGCAVPPGRARPGRPTTGSTPSGRHSRAWAGRRRRRRPGPDPGPLGVLAGLVDQAAEFAAGRAHDPGGSDLNAFVDDLDRRAAEQHARSPTGSPSPRSTPPGAGVGRGVLCGLQDGTLPITCAETRPRSRRSGGCSTS